MTVRGNTNARDEALFATLDVIDLDDPSDGQVAVLPQVGGAPGLSTQIVLVERSVQPSTKITGVRPDRSLRDLSLHHGPRTALD